MEHNGDPEDPSRGKGHAGEPLTRRRLIGGLAHFTAIVVGSRTLAAASPQSGQCGSPHPGGGVWADNLCGTYPSGLLHADAGCGLQTGGGYVNQDRSCGMVLERGGAALVGSDFDCGQASGGDPVTIFTDAACGLLKMENPYTGYFNDLACGYAVSSDNDCGKAATPTTVWTDNGDPICQFPD